MPRFEDWSEAQWVSWSEGIWCSTVEFTRRVNVKVGIDVGYDAASMFSSLSSSSVGVGRRVPLAASGTNSFVARSGLTDKQDLESGI